MLMAGQKMTNKMKKYLEIGREHLCSLLFPERCPVCDEILGPEEKYKGIHSACESKLYPIRGAVCMHCGRPIGDENRERKTSEYFASQKFESAYEYCQDCMNKKYDRQSYVVQGKSLYLYKGSIKKTMYRFKYSNKREYAAFFAKCAMEQYGTWLRKLGVEVIVPVPMYSGKQRKRGYNQAECFARELEKQSAIPMRTDLVYRIRNTAPQKGLGELQRKNNLKNAFHSGKNVVQYSCALVVDDIYTTGCTVEAVARELIKQGMHRVYRMTICIGDDM